MEFQEAERSCLICGEMITGKRIDAVYCSQICGNKFRRRKHYRLNPELYKQKRFRDNAKTERRILSRIKARSKKTNIEFNLDIDDIVIPEFCPVLGIKLVRNYGSGFHPDSASVDRIDPKKGYTKDNVRIISARANLLKSDATVEELEKVLEDLKKCTSR